MLVSTTSTAIEQTILDSTVDGVASAHELGAPMIPIEEGVIGPDHIRAEIGPVLTPEVPTRRTKTRQCSTTLSGCESRISPPTS